jgi:dihydroxy-acid dehydratase
LLAIAHEAGVDFRLNDIDILSRSTPVLCKVSPNSKFHIQDVNRAGGIIGIMAELSRAGLIDQEVNRVDGLTLAEAFDKYDIMNSRISTEAEKIYGSAPGGGRNLIMGSQKSRYKSLDKDRANGCIRNVDNAYSKDGGLAVLYGNIARNGCIVKTAGVKD